MQLRSNRVLPELSIPVDVDSDVGNGVEELMAAPEVNDSWIEDVYSEVDDQHVKQTKKVSRKRKKSSRKEKKRKKDSNDGVGNPIEQEAQSFEGISGFEFVDPHRMLKRMKKKKNGEMRPTLMWEVWEEEHSRWIDKHITDDLDLDQQNHVSDEMLDEPAELATELLRFQKEWLAWALKQEESMTRGGILADEMGMGKTVQAIALVLAKREIRRAIDGADDSFLAPSSSSALPEINCTLIICPASALNQWKREIERFTQEGSTKVLCYQGPNRVRSSLQFSEYDFIITTYNTIEADYRKVLPPKKRCQWCGKCYSERRMPIHLKYYCGPHAMKTEKQSKQNKKEKKVTLKVLKTFAKDDVSKTCDDKQEAAHKKKGKVDNHLKESGGQFEQEDLDNVEANVRKSALHSVKWERIVLDEAHSIKDRRSNTARAVLALQSSYKWALSGTPLQNRVGELYSLIRFLQISPYSYYMCKDCDCRTLDYSFSLECKSCTHSSVRHFCWWNKNVATPIQLYGNSGGGQRAMFLLKHRILKNILLRRTKSGRASDLALPSRAVVLRRDSLDIGEADYYQSLYNDSQAQFNTYVRQGTVKNNYAHIFDLLTRLRQVTSCGHLFCRVCLIDFSSSLGQPCCPSCSKPLTADFTSNSSTGSRRSKTAVNGFRSSSILNRIELDNFQTSTKIDALVWIVRFVIEDTVEERILKLQEKKELVFEGTVGGSSDALAKLTEADLKFLFVT
ncbi:ATP-dependent helicase rhp16 [Bienertia sinuspersici]